MVNVMQRLFQLCGIAADLYCDAFNPACHSLTSKPVKILLRGQVLIVALVVSGLDHHIRYHADGKQLKVPDWDPQLRHAQEEKGRCQFPLGFPCFFLASAMVSLLALHSSMSCGKTA